MTQLTNTGKARLLRLLALGANPEDQLQHAADEFGLAIQQVKDIAVEHGYPRPESMKKAAAILANAAAKTGPSTPAPTPPAAAGPGNILTAAKASKKARTRKLGDRVAGLLNDLRKALDEERAEEQARAEADRKAAEARAEVKRLEQQLAEAKKKLRGAGSQSSLHESRSSAVTATAAVLERHGVTAKDVRAWARENNVDCPTSGLLPARVVEAYDQAHANVA